MALTAHTTYRCSLCGQQWTEPGLPDPSRERLCLCFGSPIDADYVPFAARDRIFAAICIAVGLSIVAVGVL
jgi:hypothetical protein